MLSIEWNSSKWSSPRIEPMHNLSLHPAAKVLHYAIELFEGLKAYRGVDGKVRMFRPDMNMSRMHRSTLRSSLPDFDKDELLKCLLKFISVEKQWVPKEPRASLYVRPTFIATEPTLGVSEGNSALLYVIASPSGPYFPTGIKPVSLYADPTYCRAFYGGVGNFKVGSNYGPTVYVAKQAAKKSCQQVLWLYGEDHLVTEAGTMNVFFVFKNENNGKW
jgi:branched-chain amino acid aminotransferase